MAQATFNEEGLYRAIGDLAALWYRRTGRPARAVDLCAATGLCALRVSRTVPVLSVTLVDSDANALQRAAQHLSCTPTEVQVGDASEFSSSARYDLILANSAYHHIHDDRKIEFLRVARTLLADDGAILVGDHFLPPYSCRSEFRRSVEVFYGELVKALHNQGEPAEAIDIIRRSALYCWCGEYEYKVSFPIFLDHCRDAGLRVKHLYEVWRPASELADTVGTYAIWLIPSS